MSKGVVQKDVSMWKVPRVGLMYLFLTIITGFVLWGFDLIQIDFANKVVTMQLVFILIAVGFAYFMNMEAFNNIYEEGQIAGKWSYALGTFIVYLIVGYFVFATVFAATIAPLDFINEWVFVITNYWMFAIISAFIGYYIIYHIW